MVAQRYEFLAKLHEALQPRGYVEIGVQSGGSLALAHCDSVGIDPTYQIQVPLEPWHRMRLNTSDDYFASTDWQLDLPSYVDLAFIDGMHLVEYALRDFTYIERVSHPNTVVVFDDVLPYNADIAVRAQPPGDWTGDVWKVIEAIRGARPSLKTVLVDTHPTGAFVVTGFQHDFNASLGFRVDRNDIPPPHWVLAREGAVSQEEALKIIMEGRS